MPKLDKNQILERLRKYKGIKSNTAFARYLDIPTHTIFDWTRRNTFNLERVSAKFPEINPDWLISGEGEMLRADRGINNSTFIHSAVNNGRDQNLNVSPDMVARLLSHIEAQDQRMVELQSQINRLLNILETKLL